MASIMRILALVAVSTALFCGPVAQAQQGSRIGFVDTDRLINEATPAKAAQAKLEREFSQREKELDAAADALQKASDQYQRDSVTMSESQQEAAQRKLIEQDRDFQQKQIEFQDDLNARKQEELQAILERANNVVRQIADAEKFDVILQEAVYVRSELDITDKVLQKLNGSQ